MMRRGSYEDVAWFRHDAFVVRAVRNFVVERVRAELRSGATVLDVGCGEQPLRALVEERGARYAGLDVSRNQRGTVAVLGSALALPFVDRAFDLVIATEVLEHVADLSIAVSEAARVLRPGGALIATVPFMYPLHEEPRDFARPTAHMLRHAAQQAGLEVVEIMGLGDAWGAAATIVDHAWPRGAAWRAPRLASRVVVNGVMRILSNVTSSGQSAPTGHGIVARRV